MDAEAAREFLRKYQDMIESLWLERVCYRNLILDSGAIPEAKLDEMIQEAKRNPEHQRIAAEAFAGSRKSLAEFGLSDTIRNLSSKPPAKDKQN
jgi:hypothetical protein